MISKITADNILNWYGYARVLMPFIIRRPLGYFFYITGRCNLECDYCWQREMSDRSSENTKTNRNELTGKEWVEIIKSAPKFSFIGLTGGEPLLHKNFQEIIQYLGGRFPYTVNTNGSLLNDKIIDDLIRYKATNISISLDGFSDVHDISRKKVGLFDYIVEMIKLLNDKKKLMHSRRPLLTIKTVLLDQLTDRLNEFYYFCDDVLKADCINISLMKTVNHAQFDFRTYENLNDIKNLGVPKCYSYKNKDEISKALDNLLKLSKSRNCKVLLYPKMYSESAIDKFFQSFGTEIFKPCYIPWSFITILANGSIIPCLSLKIANIRNLSYNVKLINKLEKYQNFLSWRYAMNRNKESPPECNMCCFTEVDVQKKIDGINIKDLINVERT